MAYETALSAGLQDAATNYSRRRIALPCTKSAINAPQFDAETVRG
jgi:hypothetical protein